MKKWVKVIAVSLIFSLLLCGCKKGVGSPEDNAAAAKQEDEDKKNKDEKDELEDSVQFGYSVIDMENPYFITLESSISESLKEEGYSLITKDPSSDADLQNEQIMEMIEEGIDVLFLTPVDWDMITEALDALEEADVKVINIDSKVKEMDKIDAYIGSDNEMAGTICGEDLVAKRTEGGKILLLECPTQNSINDRITGFENAITSADVKFEIVERIDTNGEFQKALDATRTALEEHPEIDIIMCGNDQIAVGATTAVNLTERKDIIIYGIDGSPDIKKELVKVKSSVVGTVAQSPINMGKDAVKIAFAMLNGDDYEQETYEEVFMINSQNVDMYGVDGWQ